MLFPLLEQVNKQALPPELSNEDLKHMKPQDKGDWVVLPISSYAGLFVAASILLYLVTLNI